MPKQYRSPVMASIHKTAEGLNAADIMDKQTMCKFDEACLTTVRPLTAKEIRALREREGASQAVFARYLNVTTGLICQWKRGEKHPQGPTSGSYPLSPNMASARSRKRAPVNRLRLAAAHHPFSQTFPSAIKQCHLPTS